MDMTHFTTGNYLDKSEVPVAGKNVTIENVTIEEIDKGEHKPILHMRGAPKGMVLNKTNIKALAALCGSMDSNAWIGKVVNLYNDPTVSFGGQTVGGLRIRPASQTQPSGAPQGAGAEPQGGPQGQPAADDDIPW